MAVFMATEKAVIYGDGAATHQLATIVRNSKIEVPYSAVIMV